MADILAFLDARPDAVGAQELAGTITAPGTIDGAGPSEVAFCAAGARGALERARATRAGLALIEPPIVEALPGELAHSTVIVRSERARLAFARVVARFFAPPAPAPGIHPSAVVAAGSTIGAGASVGALCTIANTAEVGEGCIIHPGVHLYPGARLGRRVTIHSGTVVGAEGFGYERDAGGELVRIPHVGGVVIEDDVEIGANTVIDRGAIEDTWIGRGACIDNLVHIAHNVRVGPGAAVIAHAMIAGSVRLGERAWIAPGASIRDGVEIGADALVGLGAVVTRDVPAGTTVLGNPARPR